MADLELSFACTPYELMRSLFDGTVVPEGIRLKAMPGIARQIFDRMGGGQEFDVSEMSGSEFVALHGAGDRRFVALPVFPLRKFRHGCISINTGAAIAAPRDLDGKRIGVPFYRQTAAVTIRGLLRDEYGVDLSTLRWVQGAMEVPGPHGKPGPLPAMLRSVAIEDNRTPHSLSRLLADGALDAIASHCLPAAIGRDPALAPLFAEPHRVEQDYYRRTGIYPIMHVIVLRRELHERHPWVAASLYDAFGRAKAAALAAMARAAPDELARFMPPWDLSWGELAARFDGDPWPYGVAANRVALTALVRWLGDQFMLAAPVAVEDLFVLA